MAYIQERLFCLTATVENEANWRYPHRVTSAISAQAMQHGPARLCEELLVRLFTFYLGSSMTKQLANCWVLWDRLADSLIAKCCTAIQLQVRGQMGEWREGVIKRREWKDGKEIFLHVCLGIIPRKTIENLHNLQQRLRRQALPESVAIVGISS